ncbi:MAG TPA: DNA mismatch repair endonuclease MutL [Terriglobales bacterium]|nr:DNA mismatch repair endonuclease MutL [Terriglobales bacterium]
MGKIHVLSENVANQIAAGEVVERPASVVKELLENSIDAGARRIRINVEAGGKKLIQVIDDGCGMVRDDALLCFERHATSKIRNAEELLSVATLGFRGEALPSIASVSRLRLESRSVEEDSGTVVEIAGGRILNVEEAGLPPGTSISVRDLFFNTPARRKFLRAESTELSQIASLVTHYALAHPDKHFELHSSTNAMLIAPPVAGHRERIYQVFGNETLQQLISLAAVMPLARIGIPQPPPWARKREGDDLEAEEPTPGELRLRGFVSKPEIQKLNRNSIFVFVNGRLIRDRLIQHALTDAYRNILPPTVFPVVLLFLEMPSAEVDVNVHPSKVEVRFRQQSAVHDFVRDSVRATLMKARPAPHFAVEIAAHPTASQALSPGAMGGNGAGGFQPFQEGEGQPGMNQEGETFALRAPSPPAMEQRLEFTSALNLDANAARSVPGWGSALLEPGGAASVGLAESIPDSGCAPPVDSTVYGDQDTEGEGLNSLATLRPLGQVRESFILAVNDEGLWIIDQHVAHERVLFEKVLRQRAVDQVETQRLLMPMVVELTPGQQAVFAELCDELQRNGFEVEPFGSRTVAVKTSPAGIDAVQIERMLHELLTQFEREEQVLNIEIVRRRIAASIACHAAIKINTPLDAGKMEWLLKELARTECPMSCPHGRPVVLRYSLQEIQRAFKRI